MSDRRGRLAKTISTIALLSVIVGASAMLMTDRVVAGPKKPPGPLCGPDILWLCTFKDGSTQLVGATKCEIAKFEKKKKATCVPASF